MQGGYTPRLLPVREKCNFIPRVSNESVLKRHHTRARLIYAVTGGIRMSTEVQITANRTNARRSTGPRTPQGKARSSQNAVKFGLFSGTFTHAGEEKDYAALHASLRHAFDPQNSCEQAAVEQICGAVWRLRRCNQLEAAIRRARRQANGILLNALIDVKKSMSKNEPNLPAAA